MVAVGDFNAKSSNWYNKDIASDEGRKIEAVTSQNGLHQEINEPTHILNNSSSCIDSIFNSQLNLLIESGVHPSLHPNCHHFVTIIVMDRYSLSTTLRKRNLALSKGEY